MSLKQRSRNKKNKHVNHPDERWLVSYSDLMTLLFGFFVLMYSMAAAKKDSTQMMQEVAQAFQDKEKSNPQQEPAKLEDLNKELQALLNQRMQEADALKEEKARLEIEVQKMRAQDQEASKIREEKEALEKIAEQNKIENESLQKIAQSEKEQLAKKIEELENSLIQKADNKKMTENLLTQLKELKEKDLQSQKKIKELKAEEEGKSFILIFSKWDTEKHDIDLTIKNSSGQKFDFKNRTFPGVSGELVLDSRFGPGAEMWTSNKLVPGDYEIEVTLYNQYGNLNDAKVTTTIMAGLHKIVLPVANLNLSSSKSVKYKVRIENSGKILLQK